MSVATTSPDRLFTAYVFDLDGTIYLGDELLPGARELVETIRSLGRRAVFVTNNPTRHRDQYVEKLARLGIPTPAEDIVNPVVTTVAWLQQHHPDATVFVLGEQPLLDAIDAAGIARSDRPDEIDLVIASYDRTFDYRKLQIAFDALWMHRRARLIATNPDAYCPFPGGRGEPDTAAIVAAIEASTGVRCEVNLGKPSPVMLETITTLVGAPMGDCIMVGDRLYTDIAMARRAGMPSALVLTGETTAEGLAAALADSTEDRPDHVVTRIDHLLPPAHRPSLASAVPG